MSTKHILPLRLYLAVAATLLGLTVITVAASLVDFGHLVGMPALNLVVALAIATVKASLVAAIFMHLWFDHKLYSVALIVCMALLAVFIGFTLFDTLNRDQPHSIERSPVISSPNS